MSYEECKFKIMGALRALSIADDRPQVGTALADILENFKEMTEELEAAAEAEETSADDEKPQAPVKRFFDDCWTAAEALFRYKGSLDELRKICDIDHNTWKDVLEGRPVFRRFARKIHLATGIPESLFPIKTADGENKVEPKEEKKPAADPRLKKERIQVPPEVYNNAGCFARAIAIYCAKANVKGKDIMRVCGVNYMTWKKLLNDEAVYKSTTDKVRAITNIPEEFFTLTSPVKNTRAKKHAIGEDDGDWIAQRKAENNKDLPSRAK